uniref:Translational initiation factor 1 n=1 Tax=Genista tridentata subsp. tridentata TaxID=2942621 RepID=A0A976YD80_9FABA|nr:translational initiation factor 1 [Genista tridentata subsp. tridentata]
MFQIPLYIIESYFV